MLYTAARVSPNRNQTQLLLNVGSSSGFPPLLEWNADPCPTDKAIHGLPLQAHLFLAFPLLSTASARPHQCSPLHVPNLLVRLLGTLNSPVFARLPPPQPSGPSSDVTSFPGHSSRAAPSPHSRSPPHCRVFSPFFSQSDPSGGRLSLSGLQLPPLECSSLGAGM